MIERMIEIRHMDSANTHQIDPHIWGKAQEELLQFVRDGIYQSV